jgi:hypothetical protein
LFTGIKGVNPEENSSVLETMIWCLWIRAS